jgi:hypothetical protein
MNMKAYSYLPSLNYWLDRLYVLNEVRKEYDLGLADSADLDYYYSQADNAEYEYYLDLGYKDGYNPFWDAKSSWIGD